MMDRGVPFVTSTQPTARWTAVIAGKDSFAMNAGRLADYQRWMIVSGSDGDAVWRERACKNDD
jgi:hypothetical protein